MRTMKDDLLDILRKGQPEGWIPLPNAAVCGRFDDDARLYVEGCGRLVRGHPDAMRTLLLHFPNGNLGADGTIVGTAGTMYCICTEQDKHRRALANLPHEWEPDKHCTFDSFKRVDGTSEALLAARAFTSLQTSHHILVLTGERGSGKSHLLEAIGRELLAHQRSVRYGFAPDIVEEVKATFSDDTGASAQDMLWRYQATQTLLLDDLGAGTVTPFVVGQMEMLLDRRYRSGGRLRLVVATNFTRERMEQVMGGRIASRLYDWRTGQVQVVTLTAGDYRVGAA